MEYVSNRESPCKTGQHERSSRTIHLLAVLTVLLAVVAVFNVVILAHEGRMHDASTSLALDLAEEGMRRAAAGEPAGGGPPESELFVVLDSGRRFKRTVMISPDALQPDKERITVTVEWSTMVGDEQIRLYGFRRLRPITRPAPVIEGNSVLAPREARRP